MACHGCLWGHGPGLHRLLCWHEVPKGGRWYARSDYARFTWFFLSEPDACPRCGESYDAPWRKWSKK
jgi:hypothetical protein